MNENLSDAVRAVESSSGGYLALYEFMWKDLGLSGVPLLVYARIYGFCKRGGVFFESRRNTAEFLGVSERAVIKSLNKLVDRGLVVEIGRHALRSGRSTKAFSLCDIGNGTTVTVCRSSAASPNHEQDSPERASLDGANTHEQNHAPCMNGVHPAKDSKRKEIEGEGLEKRFAKYDE